MTTTQQKGATKNIPHRGNGGSSKGGAAATKTTTAKTAQPKADKPAGEKPTPKYVLQQANRKRFSFGPVWEAAVMEGKVKDKHKLVAHGVKLEVGTKEKLEAMSMEVLLGKVQAAITKEIEAEKKATH